MLIFVLTSFSILRGMLRIFNLQFLPDYFIWLFVRGLRLGPGLILIAVGSCFCIFGDFLVRTVAQVFFVFALSKKILRFWWVFGCGGSHYFGVAGVIVFGWQIWLQCEASSEAGVDRGYFLSQRLRVFGCEIFPEDIIEPSFGIFESVRWHYENKV